MVRKLVRRAIGLFKHRTMVLMYHRIANSETDPWQLSVTAENFEAQLQIIKKHYGIIPLHQLLDKVAAKKTHPVKVCITFDDAYADNYLYAKPLLEKHGCPATFFIPTACIGNTQPFWWDKLESIVLHSNHLPPSLRIFVQSRIIAFDAIETVLSDDIRQKHKRWIWLYAAPTKRCELYLLLWKHLQPLLYPEILTVLNELSNWAGYNHLPDAGSLPMSTFQLREMCRQPLFDIGVHTATHPALAYHTSDVQSREISDCRQYLQAVSGRQINSIAYPYGNYNADTLSIVKQQEFSTAFTTQPRLLTMSANPYLLGRFQVINQNGDQFKKQLHYWANGL